MHGTRIEKAQAVREKRKRRQGAAWVTSVDQNVNWPYTFGAAQYSNDKK